MIEAYPVAMKVKPFLVVLVLMSVPISGCFGQNEIISQGGCYGKDSDSLGVIINELNAKGDWIEFCNSGDIDVNLQGLSIADDPFINGEDNSSFFDLPDITLPPKGYIVFTQNAKNSFSFGLYKGGETINLYSGLNGNGRIIDSTTWGYGEAGVDDGDGMSWGRCPDGNFYTLYNSTKGSPNNCD